MKTEIQIFENAEFGQIRTMVMPDGQVGFVGKDVAMVLGYVNPTKAIIVHVDEDDKTMMMMEAESQNGIVVKTKTALINESGLYSLILFSKLPKAREFKHWVTSEVLPRIRKTGGYSRKDAEVRLVTGKGQEYFVRVFASGYASDLAHHGRGGNGGC